MSYLVLVTFARSGFLVQIILLFASTMMLTVTVLDLRSSSRHSCSLLNYYEWIFVAPRCGALDTTFTPRFFLRPRGKDRVY